MILPLRHGLWVSLAALAGGLAGAAMAAPPSSSVRPAPRTAAPSSAPVVAAEITIRPLARPEAGPRPTAPTPASLIEAARLTGTVAYMVADAETGEILEVRHPLRRLPPASTAKTVTALYGLETLGPDYRFRTRALATGPVRDGRIEGDLVLAGGGDPTLDTDQLGELTAALERNGVSEVAGAFEIYAAALPSVHEIDPGQPDFAGYNAAISGLNLNFNRVRFGWTRGEDGYDITMDAAPVGGYRPRVSTSQMQVVDRSEPVYTYTKGESVDQWTVARGVLGAEGMRSLPVRQPGAYTGAVFRNLAETHDIALPGPEIVTDTPEGQTLARTESAPLREVLRGMLKYSNNLTAEAVGLTASRARGVSVTSLADSAAAMSAWLEKALGLGDPAFVDHSGLNGATRIAPRTMVRMLQRLGPHVSLEGILKTIPAYDVRGRAAETRGVTIHAKTGTLNFVSALAGYVVAPDGRELVFSMVMADPERRAAVPPEQRQRAPGAAGWMARARGLQGQLVERWATLYF